MIKIRHSVFETNSSSSHSLVFSSIDRGYSYDLPVDKKGVLTIPFGEFGWGPDILRTPLQKLSYLVTDNSQWRIDDDSRKSWDDILEELKSNDKINEIINLVKSKCPQVKEVTFDVASSYYPRGYIDHDSVGTSNSEDPEELIFNNRIIILIDNDNECNFYHLKDSDKSEKLFDCSIDDCIRNDHVGYWDW